MLEIHGSWSAIGRHCMGRCGIGRCAIGQLFSSSRLLGTGDRCSGTGDGTGWGEKFECTAHGRATNQIRVKA